MGKDIIANIKEKKIITIIRGLEPDECLKVADALYQGGINLIEVTFDQTSDDNFSSTTKAITAISKKYQGKIYVGAGTVLSCNQVDLAKEAGALYIITPTTDVEIIKYIKSQGLIAIPGAMTPSEVVTANQAGADFIKIFPTANLGSSYIKAIKGPLNHIPLLAVGGVNEKNVKEFISAGAVGVGVGGNLINREWIKAGEFNKISELAKEFVNNLK